MAPPTRSRPRPGARPPDVSPLRRAAPWVAVGLLVAGSALIAALASNEAGPATSTPGVEETRDVQVTGSPLTSFGAGTDTSVGQPIPTVQGASFDDTPVTIGSGRPTIIAFVAHWCPHCQREVPLLAGHLASRPLPAGVDLITVATGTTPDRPNYPPSEWLAREDWPGPVLADSADGAVAEAFGLTGFPYFVAVDADGQVVARVSGEIPTSQFDELAQLALGGAGT